MELFYSGAISPSQPSNADRSLGGFISDTLIPNSSLNNLFSTITRQLIVNNQREVKLIILKNTTANSVENIKIWSNVNEEMYEKLKIGAILPAYDSSCGRYYFEQIQNSSQLPYQTILDSHESEIAAIDVGIVLEPEKMIGIWVERTFKSTIVTQFQTDSSTCSDDSIAALEQLQLVQNNDELQLIIDYSVVT